ncbi:hypothetical protein D0A40_03725 [Xanthomonas campestris pv. raphani]|nr:hypothetical protein D0A40_03725 [Xanthomonas campestris pv. raphani]
MLERVCTTIASGLAPGRRGTFGGMGPAKEPAATYVRRALRWWRASPATASLSRCSAKPLPERSAMDASVGTLIGAARSGCAICD